MIRRNRAEEMRCGAKRKPLLNSRKQKCLPRRLPGRAHFLVLASLLLPLACSMRTADRDGSTDLGGTSWQLVKFQSSDDRTLTPDDSAKYTISFGNDGSLSARIDCNRGRGTWKSSGASQLLFGPLALTRAACPAGSLHDRIVKDFPFVRSYVLKDGHLFLSLIADGGIYEFAPGGESEPSSPR